MKATATEIKALEKLVKGLKSDDDTEIKAAFKKARTGYEFYLDGLTIKTSVSASHKNACASLAVKVEDLIESYRKKDSPTITAMYRAIARNNVYALRFYAQLFELTVSEKASGDVVVETVRNFLRTHVSEPTDLTEINLDREDDLVAAKFVKIDDDCF